VDLFHLTLNGLHYYHYGPSRPPHYLSSYLTQSQMWVKGTPMHFIVDSGSHKNLISEEVVNRLALPTMPHPQPTTLDGSTEEAIFASDNSVDYCTTSIPSKTRYCVMFLLSKFVMLFWAKVISGNVMLYMSLGLIVLLLI
jgi:hypothetical protein